MEPRERRNDLNIELNLDFFLAILAIGTTIFPELNQAFYCCMTIERIPGNMEAITCILYKDLFYRAIRLGCEL